MAEVLAKVTTYKGKIVIELIAKASIPEKCHLSIDNPSCIGQVIMDTKNNLGISPEAFELLKGMRKGHDGLGDIDWFRSGDVHTFGWLGGPYAIKDPATLETSRDWVIGDYVEIPNDVPEGAKNAIDQG